MDGSASLADGLDNGSRGRHGETAAHVVLVFQYAFLEELVGTGGSLAGVDYDFAVVSAHLLPVGDFAPDGSSVAVRVELHGLSGDDMFSPELLS